MWQLWLKFLYLIFMLCYFKCYIYSCSLCNVQTSIIRALQNWVTELPKPCIHLSFTPIHATCPAHIILLDLLTRTILGEQYRSLSSSLCSFLHSPVTSSLLGPNILLNTLFSNTLSLRSSHNVSDQVSHPYKTTGKIIVPYISTFVFLEINPLKTKPSLLYLKTHFVPRSKHFSSRL